MGFIMPMCSTFIVGNVLRCNDYNITILEGREREESM